ncbi:hypothetical protein BN7_5182 [Wickerhamomyces ciferrii]|uniref:Uncharacterized protein n=1 Tax=Wickerhamomyces ciferrii (strain ATCC 14091 / BCRC 22168 / CBS 111 / JCM 3599 / NBRC 0793 / NRRL Y-1031 F-60-10) TaxID=1206466 RepID=K0KVS8_WICCF|nr:uncharacterized protein BN7_5182 [Wickerhamomyces ciferrii]CCH45599.1 hypothetical protein BN7_5182 [Wickerhamomyces ciferrii]
MSFEIVPITNNQHQYINLIRCLAAHEETSNCTIGLDSDGILTLNFITNEIDQTDAVFYRCYLKHATNVLTHHVMNDQKKTILEPVPIQQVLEGHPMFDECRKPRPI